MKDQTESWLDTLTDKDLRDYLNKIGVECEYAKIIEANSGKFAAMSGKRIDSGETYRCGMGQYAPINFLSDGVKENFSHMFEEKNGQMQMTKDALLWLELVSNKNENRVIVDDNGIEHKYLDSFVYSFICNEENRVSSLQNKYEEEKYVVAKVYNDLTNAQEVPLKELCSNLAVEDLDNEK